MAERYRRQPRPPPSRQIKSASVPSLNNPCCGSNDLGCSDRAARTGGASDRCARADQVVDNESAPVLDIIHQHPAGYFAKAAMLLRERRADGFPQGATKALSKFLRSLDPTRVRRNDNRWHHACLRSQG